MFSLTASNHSAHAFCTTQWTVVLNAKNLGAAENKAALENLCRSYWFPLYSFARRRGCSPEDAQDFVQAFFVRLLEKDYLQAVDRSKGKFRTFLLCSFSHFLHDEWDKQKRLKRGGGGAFISLDREQAEARYKLEPVDYATPDALFDRQWAQVLVDSVLEALRREFQESGEEDRFTALQSSLMGELSGPGYKEIAGALGLSEGGVKTVVRRMRLRFAALLRDQIASTLLDPTETENEMRHLLQALVSH